MQFSITALIEPIRIYQLRYPLYSPSVLCHTSIRGEYTIYKHVTEDDAVFEALSISHDPRSYRVFLIHEDCPGIDHCGIVHFISGLFSRMNIPILYVNTYAYNMVFVAEEHVPNAIHIMKTNPSMIYDEETL
jgi:hypothetical protein